MSIFQEYDSEISRNYDILFRQFEIDASRLDSNLMLESTLSELEEELFAEAETLDINVSPKTKKSENKFLKILSDIANKISKFITDVIDMFANMFSSSSHLDIDAYLSSSTGSIEMENDMRRVHKQVKDELRKGRKLIKAISNGTHIDESKIEEYVDTAAGGVQKYGKTLVKTAGSYVQFQHATGELNDLKQEMNDALADCKGALGDSTKQINVSRVYKAMRSWVAEGTTVYQMFGRNIYKEALRQQKEQEKRNKKK